MISEETVTLPAKYGVVYVKDCGKPITVGLDYLQINPAKSLEDAQTIAERWLGEPGDCVAVVELTTVSVHVK